MTKRVNNTLCLVVLAILVLASYSGALNNDYVWDDRYFLTDYAWFDSASSALKTALSPLFMGHSYVRPIPLLTLYLESTLSGNSPAASHAVNLIIHFLCSWLVFLLARSAFDIAKSERNNSLPALAIASVFAVHPALSETVLWISCRFDLLATLFMLTALKVAGSNTANWKRTCAISTLFLLSALSKEIAVAFPFIFVANEILRHSETHKVNPTLKAVISTRNLQAISGMLFTGVIYLLIRHQVLDGAAPSLTNGPAITEKAALISSAMPDYLQLSIVPFVGNSPQHSFSWDQENINIYLLNFLITISLFLTIIFLIWRNKTIGWVMFAWAVCLIPVIHILPIDIGNNSIQQRFMYLPTAIFLSLSPYFLTKITPPKLIKNTTPALIIIFIIFSILINRSITKVWENDLVLWRWTTHSDPGSVLAKENLIWAYLDRGMHKEIDREVEKMRLQGTITGPNALINVGVSHHRRMDFEKAISYYELAYRHIESVPATRRAELFSNMAVAYALTGKTNNARRMITSAVSSNPQNHVTIGNLLAFCKGQNVDRSKFTEEALNRSRQYEMEMNKILDEKNIVRPDYLSPGTPSLCPPELLKK